MKIIHTSDWHLGHELYGYDRSEEQASALEQIEAIIKKEQPDALLVSGDVFHTSAPSAAVQKSFTAAVMRMHASAPGMTIVITAGNHDSGARHEITRILWETQGVHMIGTISKSDLESHIIALPGKGWIIAVPYSSERRIPEGFWQGLLDEVAFRNEEGLPVVLSAHLTVSGADFRGHDTVRERSVGGIDSVGIDELGTGYDYVALGHIHRPQTLKGSGGRVRYSGTPIPVSFDETYPHSVSVVEIASHGAAPIIREEEIENPHPLVSLPAEGYAPWEEVKQLAERFPKDIPAYVRLNIEVENFLPPDTIHEARAIIGKGQGRFCYVNPHRETKDKSGRKELTVSEFRAMEPLAVARMYAEDMGFSFDEELERLFLEVEKDVRNAEHDA